MGNHTSELKGVSPGEKRACYSPKGRDPTFTVVYNTRQKLKLYFAGTNPEIEVRWGEESLLLLHIHVLAFGRLLLTHFEDSRTSFFASKQGPGAMLTHLAISKNVFLVICS
jgi:hypothetical protein